MAWRPSGVGETFRDAEIGGFVRVPQPPGGSEVRVEHRQGCGIGCANAVEQQRQQVSFDRADIHDEGGELSEPLFVVYHPPRFDRREYAGRNAVLAYAGELEFHESDRRWVPAVR